MKKMVGECQREVLFLLFPSPSYLSIICAYLPLEKALALDGFDLHIHWLLADYKLQIGASRYLRELLLLRCRYCS